MDAGELLDLPCWRSKHMALVLEQDRRRPGAMGGICTSVGQQANCRA